jgi:hypothetical protein
MAGTREERSLEHLASKLLRLPVTLFKLATEKIKTLSYSAKMAQSANMIVVSPAAVKHIRQVLLEHKKNSQAVSQAIPSLHAVELQMIDQIRRQTQRHNRNNVTRTQAYWHVYKNHSELHWALLAHMVSRNGGWCMTDLKGDLLPQLLNTSQIESIFAFLEKANGLIFHDAYPQLLLYVESKRVNRSLFHLLPFLQVSAFMHPVWEHFWMHREPSVLTISLIINEQNYIEQRIVQDPYYKKSVLGTITFLLQSLMQLNHVIFPYFTDSAREPRLAGLILEDFNDLKERIEFGKKLYAILFGLPTVHQGIIAFAEKTPHTGSRMDYWPQLFASIRKAPPELAFKERLTGCQLIKETEPLYSAMLKDAWSDRPLGSLEPGDWFDPKKPSQPLRHLASIQVPFLFDMTSEACLGLNKLELAILAGEPFSFSP